MFNRELITRLLLRRPAALESRTARWTILALAGIGAAVPVWSAVIHLELWGNAAFVLLAATVLLTLGVPVRAGHPAAPVPSRSGGTKR
jgi:hypothetical protein